MVLLLPPAPAALVDAGRAFATRSFWSAAARLRIAVLGPPGGVGLDGRPLAAPTPGLMGDDAPGEDLNWFVRIGFQFESRNGRLCLWACRLRGGSMGELLRTIEEDWNMVREREGSGSNGSERSGLQEFVRSRGALVEL